MPSDKALQQTIQQEVNRFNQAIAALEYWYREAIHQNENWLEDKRGEIQRKHKKNLRNAVNNWNRSVDSSKVEVAGIEKKLGLGGLLWSSKSWKKGSLQNSLQNQQVYHCTRFGSYQISGEYSNLTTPALLPIIGHKNVLIKASGNGKQPALDAMQSIMLRLLATLPSGKLQFILIDPVGLGSNVAGFVKNLPKELTGGEAWIESQHIEKSLADLSAHMATVIQKYLGNQFPTIEDYNAEAGEVREPYRFLVVANFPVNFTDEAAKRLISISTNGPRTGVYVLVMVDMEQPTPHGFNLTDLEHNANVIEYQDNQFVWLDPDYQNWPLSLDGVPPTQTFNEIISTVGKAALEASTVEVPFERVISAEREWWQKTTKLNLEAPIGQRGATDLQIFELGKGTAIHALLAGKTGSGKSNLLHVLITSLALTYSPDELELYLIDFKKGVEFKIYDTYKLPHARVIAIQSEREFGHSVLEALDAELQKRGDLFRSRGYSDLKDYREKDTSGQKLPRILLLVDEFQEFFIEDDALANRITEILDRLVKQGRGFGIHIVMGSQSLAGAYSIARSTADQMAVRIALQCSEADSRLILSDDNPAARLLSRPGEAIYNSNNGLVGGNNLFQVVLLDEKAHQHYLQQIREKTQILFSNRIFPQIVFEGNAPADLETNAQVGKLRHQRKWSARPRTVQAWLGEPIAIRPHIAAVFRPQHRSNLVIIGKNEEIATAMLFSSFLSISLQLAPKDVQFYIINLSSVDCFWNTIPYVFSKSFPHPINIIKRRKIAEAIEELANLVTEREALDDEDVEIVSNKFIFLFVIGLHRARDLRVDENYIPPFGEEVKPSTGDQFCSIIRNGTSYKIHTLTWCDTYSNFTRIIPRQYTDEFELKVALQMSENDSRSFLDSPLANKLGSHRALFFDEDQIGRLDKFRPYQSISADDIEKIGYELSQRGEVNNG